MSPRKGEKGSGRPRLPRPEPAPEASLDEPREVMTLREVAEYLNCHYSTVLRLLRDGDFPAFRLGGGGDYRCRRFDLEKWIEKQVRPTGNGPKARKQKPAAKKPAPHKRRSRK